MTLRPSRVVEQQRRNPLFAWKGASNCSACGRPLTAHESVSRGIGPVCVQKHHGPGLHPSGSAQSAHAGAVGREVSSIKRLRVDSVNAPHLVKFRDGSRGIFKTADREAGSVEAETLTYELSQTLGWDIVPKTEAFTLPDGEKGSLQEFVTGGRSWVGKQGGTLLELVYGMKRGEFEAHEGAAEMVVLDALTGNTDRHGGNILQKGGQLFAPDNDASFGEWSKIVKYSKEPAKAAKVLIGSAKPSGRSRYVAPLLAVRRLRSSGEAQTFADQLDKALGSGIGETFMANVRSMAADDLLAWSAGIPNREIGGDAWKKLIGEES